MPWDEVMRSRYQQPLEVRRRKDKERYAADPEKYKARHARYYAKHKAKTISRNWERQIAALGCTPEKYQELLVEQGHKCKLCGKMQTKRLAVDHCHSTGKVRGLLCTTCNAGLGCFNDDPEFLRKAVDYLCHGTR